MKYLMFPSLWCQSKARRRVPPLNTQCLKNSVKSGERSVLTLDSLCLPCYMRETAWSRQKNIYWIFLMHLTIMEVEYELSVFMIETAFRNTQDQKPAECSANRSPWNYKKKCLAVDDRERESQVMNEISVRGSLCLFY